MKNQPDIIYNVKLNPVTKAIQLALDPYLMPLLHLKIAKPFFANFIIKSQIKLLTRKNIGNALGLYHYMKKQIKGVRFNRRYRLRVNDNMTCIL